MIFHVYIVKCSDNTYYCGYTNDLDQRIKSHNLSKAGAKYTKSRRPVELVYSEILPSKITAMKREREIKALTRKNKEVLMQGN